MITTIQKARELLCPEDIGKGNSCCKATECFAWEFYIPPPGISIEEKRPHGIKDNMKLGYCGKIMRR
jgi:hypothetical protein